VGLVHCPMGAAFYDDEDCIDCGMCFAITKGKMGEAEISISGKPYHLGAGEMIIMPANEPHALKAVKRFKMMLVMIRS
jgi:hypothetical protein